MSCDGIVGMAIILCVYVMLQILENQGKSPKSSKSSKNIRRIALQYLCGYFFMKLIMLSYFIQTSIFFHIN
jgi:hypothetical protein